MKEDIKNMFKEGIALNKKIINDYSDKIEEAVNLILSALKNNKKILLCGNGGSATQASHIAAEFIARFKKERKALPAIALTTDLAIITAIGNDYGFDKIFERQIEALGNKGDVLIALTTSGNSPNLIKAIEKSRTIGIKTIGFLGKDGGKLKNAPDTEILIPSDNTPKIQEAHLTILHIICELVENKLFN